MITKINMIELITTYLAYGECVRHHLDIDLWLACGQVVGRPRSDEPVACDHRFGFKRHLRLDEHPRYVLWTVLKKSHYNRL